MLRIVESEKFKYILIIQFEVNILVYIIATTWFPADKTAEVMKVYQEMSKKFPPDDSLSTDIIPIASKMTKKGTKNMRISKVKRGKLYEALARTNYALAMFNDIKELKYTVELYYSEKELTGFE